MPMTFDQMRTKMAEGEGFIAALDQSGGSTPKALGGYGIGPDSWSNDEEMFGLIHKMRERIISSPAFATGKVIGAILFERTMDGKVGGMPTPHALMDKGVVPFIKIDKGLEDEANGVQMMKPMPELDALLDRAKALGVFGTKERSVIQSANAEGIEAVVAQQFEIGEQVLAKGMVPIIEPEVNIKSADRAESDKILRDALERALDKVSAPVMLKLSIPTEAGLYTSLTQHPKVLRMVALSGGFSREEACAELEKNPGMIASFSRALLNDLKVSMSDEEFDAALGEAINDIHCASIA